VWLWHYIATFVCVVGTFLLWPISALQQWTWEQGQNTKVGENEGSPAGFEMRGVEGNGTADGDSMAGNEIQDLEGRSTATEVGRLGCA